MSQVIVLSESCWPHGQDKISTFSILQTLATLFKKKIKDPCLYLKKSIIGKFLIIIWHQTFVFTLRKYTYTYTESVFAFNLISALQAYHHLQYVNLHLMLINVVCVCVFSTVYKSTGVTSTNRAHFVV